MEDNKVQKGNRSIFINKNFNIRKQQVVPLLLTFLLGVAHAQDDIVCTNRAEGELVNDFSSCGAYFECIRELPQVRQCREGYIFSQELQGCTRCYTCPPTGIATMPVPQSCTQYVLCTNGVPNYRECPDGTHWNEFVQNCDLVEHANCQETATPKPTPAPTEPPTEEPTEPPTEAPTEPPPERIFRNLWLHRKV